MRTVCWLCVCVSYSRFQCRFRWARKQKGVWGSIRWDTQFLSRALLVRASYNCDSTRAKQIFTCLLLAEYMFFKSEVYEKWWECEMGTVEGEALFFLPPWTWLALMNSWLLIVTFAPSFFNIIWFLLEEYLKITWTKPKSLIDWCIYLFFFHPLNF